MLEEIRDDEDMDNMDYDPTDFDSKNPFAKSNPTDGRPTLIPTETPSSSSSSSAPRSSPFAMPQMPQMPSGNDLPSSSILKNQQDMEAFKDWQVIYPVYFDAKKSRAEGRRVSKDMAVENPIAENLLLALKSIGVRLVFETQKTHPKDWSNPGRVRVDLRSGTNYTHVKNKSHLYRLICEYLKKNPTTRQMALDSPVYHQMKSQWGDVDFEPEPLAVPRGWKINNILPVSSPAVSGGEATEEMMKQVTDQMMPGFNMPPEPKMKKMKVRMRG